MIYWRNTDITEKQDQIIKLIYQYRALTNEHIRRLIYDHLSSSARGQKANISRFTADLKKKKLIQSFSCHPYSKELIHCLTPKGIEYYKDHALIDKDERLAGFKGYPHGDFDSGMLKPGLRNIEHTMMYLDFAIGYSDVLDIRHNLYAVKKYVFYDFENAWGNSVSGQIKKVRPDGEVLRPEGIYTIEIDLATERKKVLTEKFLNYFRYLNSCVENGEAPQWVGMLVVCKDSQIEFKKDQRLHTILKSACEGLKYYSWTFPVRIINRKKNVDLSNLLINNPETLESIGISIPSTNNPVLEERIIKEEREKQELEERERRQEVYRRKEAERKEQERLLKERKQRELIEEKEREAMEREKNKSGNRLFGRLFS